MGMRDLPDVYAEGLMAEDIHIRQIMLQVLYNTLIAIVTYVVTTPVC